MASKQNVRRFFRFESKENTAKLSLERFVVSETGHFSVSILSYFSILLFVENSQDLFPPVEGKLQGVDFCVFVFSK